MSLHSVRPTFNDLSEGDEVVIRKGYHENVFKVLTLKGDERRFTHGVTGDGTEIKFEPSGGGDWGRLTGPHGETWTLYYSFPLPEMPEEDRISYARALIGEAASYPYHETNWWEHPVAFLVDRDDDDGVYARIVSHDAGYVTKNEDDVEALSYKRLGVADILADFGKIGDMWLSKEPVKLDRTNLPAGVTAGKILIGTGIDVAITHDTTLTTVHNVAVLPGEFTPETVFAAFPVRPEKARNRAFPSLNRAVKLTPVAHWKHTAEAARHALASDEALVVVFPDPKNPDGNSEHIGILTSRGVVVYLDESFALEEFSRRGGLMPGVVHATGLKPWSHQSTDGEWDGGMDFTEEPADEDSLAHFGLDLAALGALVRGFVDDEEMDEYRAMDDQQLASHMMSLNKPRVSAQSPFSALVKPN